MIYLLGSIASSTAIFIIFKLFKHFEINRLQAIVFNYLAACVAGLYFYDRPLEVSAIAGKAWIPGAVVLGFLFIVVFNLMAITTSRTGMAVVSVATKMSVAIPILFGIFYFRDSLGVLKACGIIMALLSVYLASVKKKEGIKLEWKNVLFPALVFLGSGSIDTIIKLLEYHYIPADEVALFSSIIFACSFLIGMVHLRIQLIEKRQRIQLKNIAAGMALGLPNYFSIYFIVQALRNGWESSAVFLVNNVGIVVLATLIGLLFFKEKLLLKNWIGLVMAIFSILLVSYSYF